MSLRAAPGAGMGGIPEVAADLLLFDGKRPEAFVQPLLLGGEYHRIEGADHLARACAVLAVVALTGHENCCLPVICRR